MTRAEVIYDDRDIDLDVSGTRAAFYEREFFTFSNFSSFAIWWPLADSPYRDWWESRLWPTSEHAFQAARFMKTAPDLVCDIISARSAHVAWEIKNGNRHRQNPRWNEGQPGSTLAEQVMADICRHKLMQHGYVRKQLLKTGEAEIVEDSPEDGFWGWGRDRHGHNGLGKIWMKLRAEIQDQAA